MNTRLTMQPQFNLERILTYGLLQYSDDEFFLEQFNELEFDKPSFWVEPQQIKSEDCALVGDLHHLPGFLPASRFYPHVKPIPGQYSILNFLRAIGLESA